LHSVHVIRFLHHPFSNGQFLKFEKIVAPAKAGTRSRQRHFKTALPRHFGKRKKRLALKQHDVLFGQARVAIKERLGRDDWYDQLL
jgi:hypothetical protein